MLWLQFDETRPVFDLPLQQFVETFAAKWAQPNVWSDRLASNFLDYHFEDHSADDDPLQLLGEAAARTATFTITINLTSAVRKALRRYSALITPPTKENDDGTRISPVKKSLNQPLERDAGSTVGNRRKPESRQRVSRWAWSAAERIPLEKRTKWQSRWREAEGRKGPPRSQETIQPSAQRTSDVAHRKARSELRRKQRPGSPQLVTQFAEGDRHATSGILIALASQAWNRSDSRPDRRDRRGRRHADERE